MPKRFMKNMQKTMNKNARNLPQGEEEEEFEPKPKLQKTGGDSDDEWIEVA